MQTQAPQSFTKLGDERFVLLTTFRESGERVPTTVWIIEDGDVLAFSTPQKSGKVKRLRHNKKVELRPSGRFGQVDKSKPPVEGRAERITDKATVARLTRKTEEKYGLEYKVFMLIERLVSRSNRPRLFYRITPE